MDNSTMTTTFTAPTKVGETGKVLTFLLVATDLGGLKSRDSCVVQVIRSGLPPDAEAGRDQTVKGRLKVSLDGSASSDPDGGIVSYFWRQLSGPHVTLSDPAAPKPTFRSPGTDGGDTSLSFELAVVDGQGLAGIDTCIVNVSDTNTAPTADAGADQTVQPWATVTLDGSGSTDPDNGIASYSWGQLRGDPVVLSDPRTVTPTFAAPDTGTPGTELVFEITVTDNGGLRSQDSCRVSVRAAQTAATSSRDNL